MNWPLIAAFLLVGGWLLFLGTGRRGSIYEFPFLAGATFLGFIGPQLPALANDRFLPAGAFANAVLFTIVCAAMCGFGWFAGSRPLKSMRWTFDEKRLLRLATVLSLAGAFFYFKFSRLPLEIQVNTVGMTGVATMYLFFGKMLIFGFAIAMLCIANRPSWMAIGIALFGSVFLVDRIVITGKRGEATEFALAILLAFWFQKRRALPRLAAIAGVAFGAVGMNSMHEYRMSTQQRDGPDWTSVAHIDLVKNFEETIRTGGEEMRNGIMRIYYTNESQEFDFGLAHWNVLVFNFVPGQWVGADFKASLLADLPDRFVRTSGYEPSVGSTDTGMADAFASFWYFGALKFFFIAYVLARLYQTAMRGWLMPQILYIFGVTPGVHAITHHTQLVISSWVHMAILLLPGLLLARLSEREVRRRQPAPDPVAAGATPHASRDPVGLMDRPAYRS